MKDLASKLAGRLIQHESLARFTAARLGGPADWLYIAKENNDELVDVVMHAWAQNLPVTVLGSAANVLIADSGLRGLVVVNRISEILSGDWHDGRVLSATAGVPLTHLARRCQALGLAGMEWAIGVPGTVGGAVVNNAGAHGTDMAASVADVVVLEPSGVKLYARDELHYGYRMSILKARHRAPPQHAQGDTTPYLVLLVTFILTHDEPYAIQARMDAFQTQRKATQPGGASLGSVFKNPEGDYAGRLIETAGLKGRRVGGVEVSQVHANFFVNVGGQGSAQDYYRLIREVQMAVESAHGVHLEPEIEFLGDFGESGEGG